MRCSALATRANCHSGVQGQRWRDKNRLSPPAGCLGRGSVGRLTAPRRLLPRGVRATTRRLTISTTSGLWSRRARRSAARRLGHRGTPDLDALPGRRRRTAPPAGRQRRCLQVTYQGIARYRQHIALAQTRKSATKPIRPPHLVVARDPPCGSCVPLVCNMSKANWCRERYPLWAWGTPALSRRALSVVHSLGKYRRMSTRVWPTPDT